ncbi:acyl-CoA carboxylase subunit epsilon [Kocuria sp. M1R5S2]|uniref:acyl-CoA carboxylase subunit epsilon n=1 Tax=Kocuria rhizosphaerae TaxID=3376285 RepID=UPI00378FA15A
MSARPDGPALRFVAGNPTPEEIAAVTAVLLAHRREEQPAAGAAPGRRDQFRRMRLGLRLRPGRGAWRGTQPEQ